MGRAACAVCSLSRGGVFLKLSRAWSTSNRAFIHHEESTYAKPTSFAANRPSSWMGRPPRYRSVPRVPIDRRSPFWSRAKSFSNLLLFSPQSINNTSHLPLFSNPSPNNLFRIITKRYLYRQVKSGLVTSVVAFSIDSNQSRVDRKCSNSSWRSWKKPGGVRFSEGIIILLLQLLPPRYIPSEAWVVKVVDRDRRSSMATTQVFQDWDSPHETISSMTRTSTRKTTTKTTTRREVRKSEETRVIRRYYIISGKFVLSAGGVW